MIQFLEIAKKMSNDINKDWLSELKDYNLYHTFKEIYSNDDVALPDKNRAICFIIYAYSPESLWLDLKKDRTENKIQILNNLDAVTSSSFFTEIINKENEIVNICIFNYLEQIKSWKWRAIFDLLDYSSRMFRFGSEATETEKTYEKADKEGNKKTIVSDYDIDIISKVNKEKGFLLQQAIEKREQADTLLEQIKKEYVATDHATQQDFQFEYTESAKKKDIMSWRQFVIELNKKGTKVI